MKKYKFLILSLVFLGIFVTALLTAGAFTIVGIGLTMQPGGGQANLAPSMIALIVSIAAAAVSFIFSVMSLIRKEGKVAYFLAILMGLGLLLALFMFLT